jgi:hypothetical protein
MLEEVGSGYGDQEGQWACQGRMGQGAGGSLGLAGTSLEAFRTAAAYRTRQAVHPDLLGRDHAREESRLEGRIGSHKVHQGRQMEGIRQVGTGHVVGMEAAVVGHDL